MGEKNEGIILLAEDEASIAEMIQTILEEEGYRVMRAENGREALQLLKTLSQPPLLVLTDVMMPAMDGRELVKQMQADPVYKEIPVVVMSAATLASSWKPIKYEAFLPKPFDLDELIVVISRIITEKNHKRLQDGQP